MEEAIEVSKPSSSSTTSSKSDLRANLNRLKQLQENLNRWLHILDSPENEWKTTTPEEHSHNNNNKPDMSFKVYFKGLVSDHEKVKDDDMSVGGIGVAVRDSNDSCVFELKKQVMVRCDGGRKEADDALELKAFAEALNAAVTLGLRQIRIYCGTDSVCKYINRRKRPTNKKIGKLVDEFILIQRKLGFCGLFLVRKNTIKIAYELAKDAIASTATKFPKTVYKQCEICCEYVDDAKMFSVKKCLHTYCFSCMNKHVEAKLLQGTLPECPHENCKSNLELKSCKKFLDKNVYDTLSTRVKEASIPPTERVYCPFSNCSALMSKTEVSASSISNAGLGIGMRKCVKCVRCFCISCRVPWHDKVTCADYKSSLVYKSSNEARLKSLATTNRWRECIKCMNMIELAGGCYHILCRCGYEFCYTCGAEWVKKRPSCSCPIWDERHILYG